MPAPELIFKDYEKYSPSSRGFISDVRVKNVADLQSFPIYDPTLPIFFEGFSPMHRPQTIKMEKPRQRFDIRRAGILGAIQFTGFFIAVEGLNVLMGHHITRQMTVEQALTQAAPWALAVGFATAIHRGVTQGRRGRS